MRPFDTLDGSNIYIVVSAKHQQRKYTFIETYIIKTRNFTCYKESPDLFFRCFFNLSLILLLFLLSFSTLLLFFLLLSSFTTYPFFYLHSSVLCLFPFSFISSYYIPATFLIWFSFLFGFLAIFSHSHMTSFYNFHLSFFILLFPFLFVLHLVISLFLVFPIHLL